MIGKTAFLVCPLGQPDSLVRTRSDKLLDLVIRPVLLPLGYSVTRADLASDHPMIVETISKHILQDDLVIADLTDLNPNVFYELGKRHAINLPCVQIAMDIDTLPFDVKHIRTLKYNLDVPSKIDDFRRDLRSEIESLRDNRLKPLFPWTADDIIRICDHTVVVGTASGRDEPYRISTKIAESDCKMMILMQRSSSLILGPEQGWGEEKTFYDTIMRRVSEGVKLLHTVNLDGIISHLKRPQSIFPNVRLALNSLANHNGAVVVPGPQLTYIKYLRDDSNSQDFKPDRQARVFLAVHHDGTTEGNFVIDIGERQCAFHLRGKEVGVFIRRAEELYHTQCKYLPWHELNSAIGPYIDD